MSKHSHVLLQIFSLVLALVIVFFIRLKIFPNSPLGILEKEWLDTNPVTQTLEQIETSLTGILDIGPAEILGVASGYGLHFLYEAIAEKNIKESFIKGAFDDCGRFDETWNKEKCSDTEKNTYVFADYTLNFSITTGSLYYARDPTNNGGSYEDCHIKVYVKNLSGVDATIRSHIERELTNIGTRPWYIQTRILSDYGPIGLGGGIESQEVYELSGLIFPKADFSRIFVFFGGQEYPLSPYIALLFTKNDYLVGMFSYDNKYLPQERQEKYFTHFQQETFLNNQNNYSHFIDYLKKDTEFSTYVTTYLQKVFKVLELTE